MPTTTCNWYDPTSYSSCAGGVAKSVAGDAFQSIAQSFGSAADHAVSWLWTQINAATAVNLGGAGFNLELGIVAAIAGVVAVGLFVLQIIQSVLRREAGGIGRAFKGLVVAFIGGGVAIAVVNVLLGATDQLCQGIAQVTTGTDVAGLGKLVLGGTAITITVGGPAGLLLLSLACLVAVVIVYASLVIRKVLLVVTAVFAPLAFAGSLADITVSWTRKWIEMTVALIVSKLILVLIFVAGYGILVEGAGQAGTGETQQITQVVSGILVLCMAGFAPWLALKMVHFTGDHAHQLHSMGSTAAGGVAAGGRMAQKAAPLATAAVGGPAGGAAAGGTTAAGGAGAAAGASSTPGLATAMAGAGKSSISGSSGPTTAAGPASGPGPSSGTGSSPAAGSSSGPATPASPPGGDTPPATSTPTSSQTPSRPTGTTAAPNPSI